MLESARFTLQLDSRRRHSVCLVTKSSRTSEPWRGAGAGGLHGLCCFFEEAADPLIRHTDDKEVEPAAISGLLDRDDGEVGEC